MAEKEATKAAPPARARKRKAVDSSMAKPWNPETKGDSIEGTYLGREKVRGKGSRRDFWSYHFETTDGRVRVSSAMLNSKMNQIPPGAYCWVTYTGKFLTGNGESKNFDVDVEDGTDLLDPLNTPGAAEVEQ